ncbi:MAG: DUF92 domain-containing protein [Bacteroidetes bacterium]|nr:DUF92 domain-containing protein [Bacteroidota bacterium]
MYNDWLWFGVSFFVLNGLLITASLLGRSGFLPFTTSTKIFQILAGLICFLSPYFFESKYLVILLAFLFFLIALFARKLNFLFQVLADSKGSVYFPVSFAVLAFFYWDTDVAILQVSMLVVGLGASFSSLIGRNLHNSHPLHWLNPVKSAEGSAALMITAYFIILAAGFTGFLSKLTFFELVQIATLIGIVAALTDALFAGGTEKLFIPLVTALFIDYLLVDPAEVTRLWIIIFGILPVGWLSWRLKFLSGNGSAAMFLMAVIILGMGGWAWAIPLILFFVLSSFLTLLSHKLRRSAGDFVEKSGPRDQVQVLANGGVPLIIFLVAMNNMWPWSYVIFIVAVASAAADTWSTEIGQLFGRGQPFDILKWKPVEKGKSGGISIPGLAGGLAGAVTISSVLFFQTDYYFENPWNFWILAVVTGFSGSLIDSILGSAFQVHFSCRICGRETEIDEHCGVSGRVVKGFRIINNDSVNFLSIAIASGLGIFAYLLFIRP